MPSAHLCDLTLQGGLGIAQIIASSSNFHRMIPRWGLLLSWR